MKTTNARDLLHGFMDVDDLFEGDLAYYFHVLSTFATNLDHPYHNLTHINCVTWFCYEAVLWYHDTPQRLSQREIRNLFIAALFHDFDHSAGKAEPNNPIKKDADEIWRAVQGFRKHVHPMDQGEMANIERIIWATEFTFPRQTLHNPSISELIIRDADISQVLHQIYMQMLRGLAKEMGVGFEFLVGKQRSFYESVPYESLWAQIELQPKLDLKLEHFDRFAALIAKGRSDYAIVHPV